MYISSSVTTTNCQLCSYISQILRLYKIWGYYNKFDSMKSLGVYYCYVKISKCAYMKHGLEYIMFYVQNHIAHPSIYSNPLPVCDKLLGAPAFVTHLLIIFFFFLVAIRLPRHSWHAIIWTSAGILSIGPLWTNFSEIQTKIQTFSFKKCICKCHLRNGVHFVLVSMCYVSSVKLCPFHSGLHALKRSDFQRQRTNAYVCTVILYSSFTHLNN